MINKLSIEFALLNLGNLICCLGLSLIAPFYPTYSEKFNISDSLLGLIFAINPIGGILAALIVGKIVTNSNLSSMLSIGMLIQAVGLFFYPLLTLTENRAIFITFSLLGRFISGFGAQTFLTPLYASIPQKYKESVDAKMAIAEFFSSFGYLSGPVIGSALYSLGGFSFPFLVFASCSVIISIVLKLIFGKNDVQDVQATNNEKSLLNEYDINGSIISSNQEQDELAKIGYFTILKIFTVSSTLQIIFALCITFTYYSPTYAKYFEKNFQIPPENVGYYLSITSLAYSIGALIISKIKIDKVYGIFFGMLLVSISQFFMGPDPLTQIEPQIYVTISAQFVYGLAASPPYIFVLPQITSQLEQKFEKAHHEKCISLASGLFNAGISTGELIGPLVSGLMAEKFSFQRSSSYLGLYLIGTVLIFLPNICLARKQKAPVSITPPQIDAQL